MNWTDKQITDLLQKASDAGVKLTLTDAQIAELITVNERPGSDVGENIMKSVSKTIDQYGGKQAPYRIKAFEKQFPDKKVEIYLFSDEGTLVGKDAFNSLYIYNGDIYSVPPSGGDFEAIRVNGVKSIALADCFAAMVGVRAERANSNYDIVEMGVIESPFDFNLKAPEFLKGHFKKKNLFIKSEMKCKAEIKIS